MDFLNDKEFLRTLNNYPVKHYSVAMVALDFETEKPLQRVEGKITGGSLNIDLKTPTRRTCSLKFVFDPSVYKLHEISNLIAINKKVSFSIGIENPFYDFREENIGTAKALKWKTYGRILWFPQGIYVITKANSQISTNGGSVSCNLIDKMAKLNGVCGGTIPASTSLHDRITIDEDGNTHIDYPIIKDIIREIVHHFGDEAYSRIIIEDVPEVGRRVVRYQGDSPINFSDRVPGGPIGTGYKIGTPPIAGFGDTFYPGDNIGYMETPLTYPGELIMKAGSTVVTALNEIVKTLGDYEYFYDTEGNFHFRKIKSFSQTGNTPLNLTPNMYKDYGDEAFYDLYMPNYSGGLAKNDLADGSLITSLNINPDFGNIKNDFVCWGTRKKSNSDEVAVRYHLAIDERPRETDDELLCHLDIWEVRDDQTNAVLRYLIKPNMLNPGEKWGKRIAPDLRAVFSGHLDLQFNWREELYRKALVAFGTSTRGSYYDEELIAEWRNIYDPMNSRDELGAKSFQKQWEDHFGTGAGAPVWGGYTIDTIRTPENIRYWLDIIDSSAAIGKYSVSRIGRRSKVIENNKINEVFTMPINDLIFIENPQEPEKMQEKAAYYISIGQSYCFITSDIMPYFVFQNSYGTCYEEVRAMLEDHLFLKTSISMQTIPILYLNVGEITRIALPDYDLSGNFLINKISVQLSNSPIMNITANEANVKI